MTATNPYDKAHELARAIKGSDAYRNYLNAKEEIEKNLEAKQKIYVLRQHQMDVNRAQVLGEKVSEDKLRDLAMEYAQLTKDPGVAAFFEAERTFIQLYNELMEIIHKAVETELQE